MIIKKTDFFIYVNMVAFAAEEKILLIKTLNSDS